MKKSIKKIRDSEMFKFVKLLFPHLMNDLFTVRENAKNLRNFQTLFVN